MTPLGKFHGMDWAVSTAHAICTLEGFKDGQPFCRFRTEAGLSIARKRYPDAVAALLQEAPVAMEVD